MNVIQDIERLDDGPVTLTPSRELAGSRDAADAYEALGKLLDKAGLGFLAAPAYEAAARIDGDDDELQSCWGGPMNGQEGRRRLVQAIVEVTAANVLVETGTFRGITTEWFAQWFTGSIYTCEIERRFFLQSRAKLARFQHVEVMLEDSRVFLHRILPRFESKNTIFFYLDAHWFEDVPLVEEIKIILESNLPAAIMIDDFKIPNDDGYAFDDYGPGKRLDLGLLADLPRNDIRIFMPTLPSHEETGARRGCCVLASASVSGLDQLNLLREVKCEELRIAELEAALVLAEDRNRYALTLEESLQEKSEHIRSLEEKLASRDEHIRSLQGLLAEQDVDPYTDICSKQTGSTERET